MLDNERKIERPSGNFVMIKRGTLVHYGTGKEFSSITGRIIEIRTQKDEKYGGINLQLIMADADTGEICTLTGRMLTPKNTITTWARVLIEKLANPANPICRESIVRIEVEAIDTGKGQPATIVSVVVINDAENGTLLDLPGIPLSKEDLTAFAQMIHQAADNIGRLALEAGQTSRATLQLPSADQQGLPTRSVKMPAEVAPLYGAPSADPYAGACIPDHTDDDHPF